MTTGIYGFICWRVVWWDGSEEWESRTRGEMFFPDLESALKLYEVYPSARVEEIRVNGTSPKDVVISALCRVYEVMSPFVTKQSRKGV